METLKSEYIARQFQSLNRTMQYGNHKERQEEWVSFEGLNRTMQYGNYNYKQD